MMCTLPELFIKKINSKNIAGGRLVRLGSCEFEKSKRIFGIGKSQEMFNWYFYSENYLVCLKITF